MSNIMMHFGNAVKSSVNVGRNEIDEVHIIYNYLKSKESSCKYITIPDEWIDDKDSVSLNKAVNKFILWCTKG